MRKLFFAATCVPALALASAASAQDVNCDDGWTALNEQVTKAANDGALPGSMQADLQSMTRVARSLYNAGYQDACEGIVEAIKDMAENEDSAENYQNASNENNAEGEMSNEDMPDWKKDLQQAQRLGSIEEISIEELNDLDVHSSITGWDVGGVTQVLEHDGTPKYFVLSHGGFLDIGDKDVVVPFEMAKISQETETLYVEMTDDQLDAAPGFDVDKYENDPEAYLNQIEKQMDN